MQIAYLGFITSYTQEILDRTEGRFPNSPKAIERATELYGLTMSVLQFAEGFHLLAKSGKEVAAIPLARTAFEHAITLQWILQTPEGVDRYINTVVHKKHNHDKALATWTGNEDLLQALKEKELLLPEGKRLGKTSQLIEELDGKRDGFFMRLYDILSQTVHVSPRSVIDYRQVSSNGRSPDLKITDRSEDLWVAVVSVALSVMWTAHSWAELTDDDDLRMRLEEASKELRLPLVAKAP